MLRPGGRFLAKTPNKWHYMPLIARMTPRGFHRYYNRLRGRAVQDTFKTHYRANSPRAIRQLAEGSGLRLERVDLVERGPEYLRLSPLTYVIGRAYERFVNSSEMLSGFRILMIAEFRKPDAPGACVTETLRAQGCDGLIRQRVDLHHISMFLT